MFLGYLRGFGMYRNVKLCYALRGVAPAARVGALNTRDQV